MVDHALSFAHENVLPVVSYRSLEPAASQSGITFACHAEPLPTSTASLVAVETPVPPRATASVPDPIALADSVPPLVASVWPCEPQLPEAIEVNVPVPSHAIRVFEQTSRSPCSMSRSVVKSGVSAVQFALRIATVLSPLLLLVTLIASVCGLTAGA
jgi:hypothetical protein